MVWHSIRYQSLAGVHPAEIPGRWVAYSSWPAANARPLVLHMGRGSLAPAPVAHESITHVGDKIVGLCKPQWMPSRPDDQPADDMKSLVFDSRPLDADTEILGSPLAKIRVSSNTAVA